ncbi:MAG: N-acetylmuramoyl-L-alanine amidase [Pseudomonadota bacterium]
MTVVCLDAPSPNHGDRKGRSVSLVVLHYTGMKTGQEALDRLRDPEAGVSAHYLLEEDGRAFSLVPEDRRAWHAGVSSWAGETDVNSISVGIEIVNPGHEHGYRAFPDAQIETLIPLLRGICQRHSVPPRGVVGHSDVAPDRKEDPGELFPWDRLADEGLALAPWSGAMPDSLPAADDASSLLDRIGYGTELYGLDACVTAFHRRFYPQGLGQGLSPPTLAAIAEVSGR